MSDESTNNDQMLQVPQSHADRERLPFPLEALRTPWPGHERHGDDCSACTIGPWRCMCGGLIHDAADERACDRCNSPVVMSAPPNAEAGLLDDLIPGIEQDTSAVRSDLESLRYHVQRLMNARAETTHRLDSVEREQQSTRRDVEIVARAQSDAQGAWTDEILRIRAVATALREIGATHYRCHRFELDLGAERREPDPAAAAPERTERDKAPPRDPREDAFAATGSIPVKIEDVRGGK